MNTKNIFKTLAFAMLMPTMLLTTSCSSEDDLVNNNTTETVAKKGYALPVTVNVTRGDGATRASYNESTRKLEFSDGDQLFVEGSHAEADRFAGTLDYDAESGKFSGTIYTESPYEGTIDDLLNGNYATLLPAGYESYDYLEILDEGYEAHLGESANNSFATSKKLAVEQLSFETGEYTSGTGFTLNPCNAILNFTITGLTPSTKVTASLSEDGNPLFNIEGDVTTDGSGNATFAMGVFGTRDLNELSLTVAGNPVTLVNSSTELAAGKIYNISRNVLIVNPVVGQVIGDNGKNYANAAAAEADGATAVAVIAYVGSDTKDATFKNGLAIALADEGEMRWSPAKSTCEGKTAITGAKWCLPSEGQWPQMFAANGGNGGSYTGLNTTITNAGGTTLQEGGYYWSSTEEGASRADFVELHSDGSAEWWFGSKDNSGVRARACLAF